MASPSGGTTTSGATSRFAALDVASDFVIGKCCKRHRATEFLDLLKEIDARISEGLDSTCPDESPSGCSECEGCQQLPFHEISD